MSPDSNHPHISVVIPCFDGVEDTRACLAALRRSDGPIRDRLEILIVDNGSTDATRWIDREFPEVRLVRSPTNLGFAGGVNLGVEHATGTLVLVLNNDTQPGPGMVARLEHGLLTDPRIAIAAPTSNHVKGSARVEVGDLGATHEGRVGIEAVLRESCGGADLEDVETLSGLCMLMRRETFQEFDGFDARFGSGMFEDDDLSLRIRLTGRRLVVVRDAFVHHLGHRTFDRMGADVAETMAHRRAQFAEKWGDHPAGRAYLARLAGDEATAVEAAAQAICETPSWPDGHVCLARAAYRNGDHAALLAHTESYVAASPRHGFMAVLHAVALLATGARSDGVATFRAALDECYFTPEGLAEALAMYGRFFVDAGEPDSACPHLENAHDLAPENVDYTNLLAAAWIGVERYEDAQRILEGAPAHDHACSHNLLGICAWNLGEPARAVREFRSAIALCPDDPAFRENLARAEAAAQVAGTSR